VPTISKQFNSFGDIAWYEAGFLLPFCMLQPLFGRIYKFYSIKWTLIVNTAIFEVGSIVCATALESKTLILGRVITGIGGAGVPPGARYRCKRDQSTLAAWAQCLVSHLYLDLYLADILHQSPGAGAFGSMSPLEVFRWLCSRSLHQNARRQCKGLQLGRAKSSSSILLGTY
jgi:MFS family permease